jgi:ribonuclease HII
MDAYESEARELGFRFIAGIDEAGRGPLAGPVVAAAVILPEGYRNGEIADSKALSPGKRETLYGILRKDAVAIGIGRVDSREIDRLNILQATLQAMKEAVVNLLHPCDYLLIDGLNTLSLPLPQKALVKGDSRSLSIASASIIAKVFRDRIMDEMDARYPLYGFRKHKGYGTRQHREAICLHGPCPIHRLSFRFRRDDLT